MKITKTKLKRIIKEELESILSEQSLAAQKPKSTQMGAAIRSVPDLIKLVCAPPVEIKTGALGRVFGMKNIKVVPAPRDILKAELKKVIMSDNPIKQMNMTVNNMFELLALSGFKPPMGLNAGKIQNMVLNYKPGADLPIPIPGLPRNPTLGDIMDIGVKHMEQLSKNPLTRMGVNMARRQAASQVDGFIDQMCATAKQYEPEIKKAADQVGKAADQIDFDAPSGLFDK
jgi:hypothetical protein